MVVDVLSFLFLNFADSRVHPGACENGHLPQIYDSHDILIHSAARITARAALSLQVWGDIWPIWKEQMNGRV